MPWHPIPLSYAIAIYPFQPSSSPAELPLQIGDQLYVIEQGGKEDAWCRGYLVQQPSLTSALNVGARGASDARVFSGIFPRCCVEIREQLGHENDHETQPYAQSSLKPQAPVPMLKIGDESPTSTAEPLVDEISSCLREWYISYLPDLILRQDYERLDCVAEIVTKLDYARRELLNDVLTAQERISVRNDAVWHLVRGNKLLGAEVIVRDPEQKGRLLTADDSAVEMTKLQSVMSVLNEPPVAKQETTNLYHCMLETRASHSAESENVNLSLALYQKQVDGTLTQLSETSTASAIQDSKTLFADLTSRDITSAGRLFLMARASAQKSPRLAPVIEIDRTPSAYGHFNKTRDSLVTRRRSNLVFGSKRRPERPAAVSNGKPIASIPETSADQPSQESAEPQKKPIGPPVPRTIGLAVLDVADVIKSGQEAAFELDFWTEAADSHENEQSGPTKILAELLQSRNPHFTRCRRLRSMSIEMKSFTCMDAETLIRMNPTSMHMISKSQRIGFSEAPSRRRSDIYLTISKAVIQQNGAYSHPQFGAVPVRPAPMLNLQTTMELRDSNGKRLERCIYASANGPAVTALRTHAVELDALWDQTICIRLPLEKVQDAHIVLSVADAPGFPFALAWMPLWDKDAFRQDGNHSLILHAYDKSTSTFSNAGQGMYLNLPWDHATLESRPEAPIASLEVKTLLVSTEFSQDRTLANLLNWRNLKSALILETLQKLVFAPGIEIVKQLDEVLDALFEILEYKAGIHKFEDLIFNNIVSVLGIVHDRRFNLGPLVERYVDEHFQAPVVAPSLVRSFTRLMQSVSDPQSSRDLRALFKVGKQFIRLLMATYWQHNNEQGEGGRENKHASFQEDMKAVFFGLQMMMRSETAALVGSKTLLTQNFHSWLPELLTVYSKAEVIEIAIDVIDACEESTGKLSLYRLVLILNYTKLDKLWDDDKDWDTLVENCLRWLELHWPAENELTESWRDQIRLSSSIVASLLTRPTPALHGFLPAIIKTYTTLLTQPQNRQHTLSLLFPSTYPFTTKKTESTDTFDEALLELLALVSEIIKIQPIPKHTLAVNARTTYISQTLDLVQSILSDGTSPLTWLSLNVSHHTAALNLLTHVARELQEYYIPSPGEEAEFNTELWKAYFDNALYLVSSPALTLETFSEQKRRAVWKIAGDVRQAGADLLRRSWAMLGWEPSMDDQRRYNISRLGGYQVQYVPSLVAPVIELCFSMHEGLRRVGVEILQTMIISEWGMSETLEVIETEVIEALHAILRGRADSASTTSNEIVARKLFVSELLESFNTIANQPEDALWTSLEYLVSTIEELIDLLSGIRPDEEEEEIQSNRKSNGTNRAISTDLPERSISRLEGKVYGTQALEMYKQLAEEYERAGDFMRLAKTHRAMARIHETRATSRLGQREHGEDGINEEENE